MGSRSAVIPASSALLALRPPYPQAARPGRRVGAAGRQRGRGREN